VSDNNNNETKKKEDIVAPSMNPEERPNLRDYKSGESSEKANNCEYCKKSFSNMEELTAHYRKEHPESF
jgi:hypothetical protein